MNVPVYRCKTLRTVKYSRIVLLLRSAKLRMFGFSYSRWEDPSEPAPLYSPLPNMYLTDAKCDSSQAVPFDLALQWGETPTVQVLVLICH